MYSSHVVFGSEGSMYSAALLLSLRIAHNLHTAIVLSLCVLGRKMDTIKMDTMGQWMMVARFERMYVGPSPSRSQF